MTGTVGVVVPAAGKGERLGRQAAKTLVPLAGRALILHTLQAFQDCPLIDCIVVVGSSKGCVTLKRLAQREGFTKVSSVVRGGASRAASVSRGLAALPSTVRWAVIHDGARPCVRRSLIERVVREAQRHGAVACGLPASLTVKAVDEAQQVRLTLDREGLWLVQTPQAFRRDWLMEALSRVDHQLDRFPDDAAILEWADFPVRMVLGDPLNIKVTTAEDLLLAEAILRSRGSGKVTTRRRGQDNTSPSRHSATS